ncbi:MAG: TetR/AcrR family transcriptional regulator [Hyphomonas sp.]
MTENDAGRTNQKKRTRKDLLEAASRLLKQGIKPTLEEVAEEAMVSRATAYRYFPSVETLLLEAPLDLGVPGAAELFADADPGNVVERLERVDDLFQDLLLDNETHMRLFLASSLTAIAGSDADALPVRQNRRSALIEAALAPVRDELGPQTFDLLSKTLAVIIATEGMVVFRDVLQADGDEARRVKRWAIRALVEAARRDAGLTG